MRALDRKLLRDLKRLWAQSLAVALVMACGVATLLIGVGAHQSLSETRAAYYARAGFADVFAHVTRAPMDILQEVRRIDGVAYAEARVVRFGLVEIPGAELPINGQFVSIPDSRDAAINRILLRSGRLPTEGSTHEAVINESFAKAHGLVQGSRIDAVLNGVRRRISITGVALSPEFIYAIGPGDIMPDDRRFGVFWMRQQALAPVFKLDGAFNDVSISLLRGVNEREVLRQVDKLLERYGGQGAYGRGEQVSHAFLDAELQQLALMSRILPPIFLIVTAFLINMVLSRLIGLEREQIGLLKAIGYAPSAIAVHYLKLVLVISLLGMAIGFALGTWLGFGLTRLYQKFFHFPYLIFSLSPSLFVVASAVSVAAAILGAIHAVAGAAALPPAVAMQPPAPPVYRRLWAERLGLLHQFSQLSIMALRHIVRWPLRAAVTVAGIAVSVMLLVASLFFFGAIDRMIMVTFDRADRQDATIAFADPRNLRAVEDARRLPGVMVAEPYRSVAARLSNGQHHKRVSIIGKPRQMDLSRVLDTDLNALSIPSGGLVLDETLARTLEARRGDVLNVELFGTKRRFAQLPITDIIRSYFGLAAFIDMAALARVLGEEPQASGIHLLLDPRAMPQFLARAKAEPALSALALQRLALAKFRETIAENIFIQIAVYASLATAIAFGVVYNSARIQFSERARELACLRVLGFSEWEVSRVLLVEFVIFTLIAIPLGWLAGYGVAYVMTKGFQSDLYRLPFVVPRATYAWSAFVVMLAVAVSALVVRRRVAGLDLIGVLKTRD